MKDLGFFERIFWVSSDLVSAVGCLLILLLCRHPHNTYGLKNRNLIKDRFCHLLDMILYNCCSMHEAHGEDALKRWWKRSTLHCHQQPLQLIFLHYSNRSWRWNLFHFTWPRKSRCDLEQTQNKNPKKGSLIASIQALYIGFKVEKLKAVKKGGLKTQWSELSSISTTNFWLLRTWMDLSLQTALPPYRESHLKEPLPQNWCWQGMLSCFSRKLDDPWQQSTEVCKHFDAPLRNLIRPTISAPLSSSPLLFKTFVECCKGLRRWILRK